MKRRDRFTSTREALTAHEEAFVEELARSTRERLEERGHGNDLGMLQQHPRHQRIPSVATAAEARRLKSFSERMTDAVQAHADLVDRLSRIGRRRR